MAYTLQLGPLKFVTAVGPLTEQLGDALEVVGSSLVAGERKPRSFALKLPVRADVAEADRYATGLRMRRQVRQLMENTAWRMQGLPFSWSIDPELDCWLLVGGGDLTDPDNAGITLGEWQLELTDCYVVGRPGTHRAGRRLDIADRRTGLVPRTSFGRVFSTDYASTPPTAYPAMLPGSLADLWSSDGAVPSSSGGNYTMVPGLDGNVITYEPQTIVPTPGAHVLLEEWGAVRLWDVGARMTNLQVGIAPGTTTDATRLDLADRSPDDGYRWERVLGPVVRPDRAYAIDNGDCRCRWTGTASDRLLLVETVNSAGGYDPVARVRSTGPFAWMVPVEVTADRVVVEYGSRARPMRIILQRGWTGPRIEAVSGVTLGSAAFSIEVPAPATQLQETPSFVYSLKSGGTTVARVAGSHAAAAGDGRSWSAPDALAVQMTTGIDGGGVPPAELAALSLLDVRAAPVLVPR